MYTVGDLLRVKDTCPENFIMLSGRKVGDVYKITRISSTNCVFYTLFSGGKPHSGWNSGSLSEDRVSLYFELIPARPNDRFIQGGANV